MKKLIGLLSILFLTNNVFGQINLGDLSRIETMNITENIVVDDISYVNFIIEKYYGKFLYMLAYEPNFPFMCYDGMKRNVYLYCIDITKPDPNEKYKRKLHWIRASDAVMTNSFIDIRNYRDVDFYMYDTKHHNTSNSNVVFNGNDLIFTLEIHAKKDGSVGVTTERFVLKLYKRTFDGNFYETVK